MVKGKSKWLIGLVAAASSTASLAQSATSEGFCRRPPALMNLKPEARTTMPGGARLFRASFVQDVAPEPEAGQTVCPDGSFVEIGQPCPPPAPPSPERYSDESAIVVTATKIGGKGSAGSEGEAGSGRYNGRTIFREPPAGLLTAGDHDELLNPELYALYVNQSRDLGQQIPALPVVDTRRTITVQVKDEKGRPVAMRRVRLECSDGNMLDLTTLADGRAVFFPELDRLSDALVLNVDGDRRAIQLPKRSGSQTHNVVVSGDASQVQKLDLMIVLDCTGSMSDEIAFLKSELRAILDDLKKRHLGLDLRVGLVAYRDIGDDFVTRTYRLTDDLDGLQDAIAGQSGNGGGDMPEAVDEALARGVQQEWRDDALHSLLWVADAPPHDEKMRLAFDAAEVARAKRIQIVPVASSGVDERAEYFMRAAAAITQSRYVFLTDDSGIGNPHAEPEVACYVVTSLASTIRRVLDSQLSGRRVEPGNEEVIRVNGIYDHGKCELPNGFTTRPKKRKDRE